MLTEIDKHNIEKAFSMELVKAGVSPESLISVSFQYEDDLEKGFGSDMQKRFPNGRWVTMSGAKVFVDGNNEVVAGLDKMNKKIDDSHKTPKQQPSESKKDEPKQEMKIPQTAKEFMDMVIESKDMEKIFNFLQHNLDKIPKDAQKGFVNEARKYLDYAPLNKKNLLLLQKKVNQERASKVKGDITNITGEELKSIWQGGHEERREKLHNDLMNSDDILSGLRELSKIGRNSGITKRMYEQMLSGTYNKSDFPNAPKPKLAKDNFDVLTNIASNDGLRPPMTGVHYDPEGYMVSTDTHKMIAIESDIPEDKKGKTIGKSNEEIEGNYPNWKYVLPEKGYGGYDDTGSISVKDLHNISSYAKNVHTKVAGSENNVTKFNLNGKEVYFNARIADDALKALRGLGVENVNVIANKDNPESGVLLEGKNKDGKTVKALIMPLRQPNPKSFVIDSTKK